MASLRYGVHMSESTETRDVISSLANTSTGSVEIGGDSGRMDAARAGNAEFVLRHRKPRANARGVRLPGGRLMYCTEWVQT